MLFLERLIGNGVRMLKLVDMVALGLILSARELDEVGGAIDIIEMVPPEVRSEIRPPEPTP